MGGAGEEKGTWGLKGKDWGQRGEEDAGSQRGGGMESEGGRGAELWEA